MKYETVVDLSDGKTISDWSPLLGDMDLSTTTPPTTTTPTTTTNENDRTKMYFRAIFSKKEGLLGFDPRYPQELKGYVSEETHKEILDYGALRYDTSSSFWISFSFCLFIFLLFVVSTLFLIYSFILWIVSDNNDLSSVGGGDTDSDGETEMKEWVLILLIINQGICCCFGTSWSSCWEDCGGGICVEGRWGGDLCGELAFEWDP